MKFMLRPFEAEDMDCYRVSPLVNNAKSDWPECLINESLRRWVEITGTIIAGENRANQRKLFFENAARIYRLRTEALPTEAAHVP